MPEMCHRGRGGWRRHCRGGYGNNPHWKHVANHWINVAKEFVNNATQGNDETKEGETEGQGDWGFGKKRSKWSENRAIFVAKPEDVLQGEPGSVLLAPVEIKNETKWPWKRGCFIGLLNRNAPCDLIVSDVPVDFEVRGMQTFKLNIPIQIPVNISTEKGDTFDVAVAFFGPKGSSFGQVLHIKVKVTNPVNLEEKVYRGAIQLTELGMGTFDDCVDACRKAKGDVELAIQTMLEK